MTFNKDIGVIYDTIYYNLIHFNKNKIIESHKKFNDINLSVENFNYFQYYNKFIKNKLSSTPPDIFEIFFDYTEEDDTLLLNYIKKYFINNTLTIDNLLKRLNDSYLFKRYMYYYYLKDYNNQIDIELIIKGNSENIAKAMVLLKNQSTNDMFFIKFFFHFDDLYNEFIKYIINLFNLIKQFHLSNKIAINNIKIDFNSTPTLANLKKHCNIPKNTTFLQSQFSISLFNQNIFIYNQSDKNNFLFVLGDNFKNILSISSSKFYKITFSEIATIFSNNINISILDELLNKDLTISQLSIRLNVSRTSIDRLVKFLYNCSLLIIKRKNGKAIYYTVNRSYFITIKQIFNDKIDDYMNKG